MINQRKKKNKEKNDDDDEKISMFRLVDFKLNLCGIVLKIMLEIFVEYGMKFLDQPVQLRKEKKSNYGFLCHIFITMAHFPLLSKNVSHLKILYAPYSFLTPSIHPSCFLYVLFSSYHLFFFSFCTLYNDLWWICKVFV